MANIAKNTVVSLEDIDHSNTSRLQQVEGTVSDGSPVRIIDSHTTGLFTARQSMEVLSDVSQTFNVRLFMANSAVALVLNPKGHNYTDLKVYATGFASQFNISDSVYVYPAESTGFVTLATESVHDQCRRFDNRNGIGHPGAPESWRAKDYQG